MEIINTEEIINCSTCDNTSANTAILSSLLRKPVCIECLAVQVTMLLEAGFSVDLSDKNTTDYQRELHAFAVEVRNQLEFIRNHLESHAASQADSQV